MPTGVVKWFDCKKGFGFIIDSAGLDVFVHHSVIDAQGFRRLDEGETVEYDATRGPRGLAATRVRSLAPPPERPPAAAKTTPASASQNVARE